MLGAGVLLIGVQIAIRITRYSGASAETQLQAIGAFSFALGLSLFVLAAWKIPAVIRDVGLARRFTEAVVLSGVRTPGLQQAFALLSSRGASWARDLPMTFTLVETEHGIGIYGSSKGPAHSEIPWAEITEMEAGQTEEVTRRSNAILLQVNDVPVPIVITGGGVAGLFPLGSKKIGVAVSQLRETWEGARAS